MLTQLPDFHALSGLSCISDADRRKKKRGAWHRQSGHVLFQLPMKKHCYLLCLLGQVVISADIPQQRANNPGSVTFYKDLDKSLLSFQLLSKSTSTRTQEMRGKRKDAKISL